MFDIVLTLYFRPPQEAAEHIMKFKNTYLPPTFAEAAQTEINRAVEIILPLNRIEIPIEKPEKPLLKVNIPPELVKQLSSNIHQHFLWAIEDQSAPEIKEALRTIWEDNFAKLEDKDLSKAYLPLIKECFEADGHIDPVFDPPP